ncbi:MAG: DNA topoisomerase III [Verrucomicrobiaceae bacterium]|nr:MAG: DNA topoisomerase III [Verrucomicrobiaceae bacterium]
MGKTLIIAEKPSVATDLARVLGKLPGMTKFEKEKDYFENDTHIISSAVGHLLELALPESLDGKKPKWNFESLPILPDHFALNPIDKSADRLAVLKRLIKRSDVTAIINACDAGREGELIFRYIIQSAGSKKPVQRLWMQSMTPDAITAAYKNLRSDHDMQPLADAAVCRSESDWLVGINSTRALTAFNSRNGGFMKTPVGRVQTPTLAILASRAKEIAAFVPRAYWEVFGDFQVTAGEYRGRWFNEAFKKDDTDPHARPERLWDAGEAEAIRLRTEGKPGKIEETRKPAKQAPPQLYDLTSLQREASNRFGFSARRTLQLAQALYEAHKVLTYPRTDSRYLPEDYLGTVKGVMSTFAGMRPSDTESMADDLSRHAGTALAKNYVYPNKRVFDTGKVSDHFAIIPTGQIPKKLSPEEGKIFDMVTRRFIAVFFPSAEFELTTRITRVGGDAFKTDGKVMRVPGWLEVYGRQAAADGEQSIVPARDGEPARPVAVTVEENVTKAPPHFTEATLLSTMEAAGKLVDDDELREAMSERGLGTPATRAATIEGLIFEQYILRNGRELIATPKGISLIDQLGEIGVDVLTSPEMTGDWEFKLKQMEAGKLDRPTFMNQIRRLTTDVVDRTRQYALVAKTREYDDLPVTCPNCGEKSLKQTDKAFQCRNPDCGFRVFKTVAGRVLTEEEAITLISTRHVGPLEGFRNRFGQEFAAALELTPDFKVGFQFQKTEVQEKQAEALEDRGNALCPCPVCKLAGRDRMIFDTESAYICESQIRNDDDACKPKAKLSKEMCQFQIPPAQAVKYFTEGKTDLIDKFVSKKGRPFTARLVCKTEGSRMLDWEFPEREPKEGKEGAAPPRKRPAAGPGGSYAAKKTAGARKSPARKAAPKRS